MVNALRAVEYDKRLMVVSGRAHPALADRHPANAVSWREMLSHRDYLVRFAQRKLHDPMLAEDAVHDVFEAVLSGRASFELRLMMLEDFPVLRSPVSDGPSATLKAAVIPIVLHYASADPLG